MQVLTIIDEARGRSATAEPMRRLHLHFLQTPAAVETVDGRVAGLHLCSNVLATDATGAQVVEPTGAATSLPVQMLLKSVGYRAAPVPSVPFDDVHGTVPNEMGRVLSAAGDSAAGRIPGLYVCGWLKRGPSGIIGTNLVDAEQTAGCVRDDLAAGAIAPQPGRDPGALASLLAVRHALAHHAACIRQCLLGRRSPVSGVASPCTDCCLCFRIYRLAKLTASPHAPDVRFLTLKNTKLFVDRVVTSAMQSTLCAELLRCRNEEWKWCRGRAGGELMRQSARRAPRRAVHV